jgi:hypothetical protein
MPPGPWPRAESAPAGVPAMRGVGALVAIIACALLAGPPPSPGADAVPATTGVHDSRHYHIESDAGTGPCLELADGLECLHAWFANQFAGRIAVQDARMRVRFFKERAGFLAYAAASCPDFNPGWFGYYSFGRSAATGELVAYDLGANRAVIYHEAFHQFLHGAYPAIRSYPQWFNEGLADVIGRGRVDHGAFALPAAIDRQDLGLVRAALKDGSAVPLARLLELDLRAWNGEHMILNYAEGYLFITFLLAPGDERRSGLLPAFFSALSRRQDYAAAYASTLGAYGLHSLEQGFAAFLAADH